MESTIICIIIQIALPKATEEKTFLSTHDEPGMVYAWDPHYLVLFPHSPQT
jgi:hypothetical protein